MKIGVHSACLSGAMIGLMVVYVVSIVREEPIYVTLPPVTRRDKYYNVKDGLSRGGGMCSGLLNNGSWTRNPVSVRCVSFVFILCISSCISCFL